MEIPGGWNSPTQRRVAWGDNAPENGDLRAEHPEAEQFVLSAI